MTEAVVRNTASVVMYRLGGRNYPLIIEPRCKTCQSPYRFHVENEVLNAVPATVIARNLSAQDPDADLAPQNIRDHVEHHMPAREVAYVKIAERRAQERGRAIGEGMDNFVTGLALAETVVKRTWEGIADGKISPTVRDGLRAAQILEMFEGLGEGMDESLFVEAFTVYWDVTERWMPTDLFAGMTEELERNPVLKMLIAQVEAMRSGQTVPGEVASDSQESLTTAD